MKRLLKYIFLLLPLLPAGCKFYSFSGRTTLEGVKTATVHFFPNQAQIVQPTLSQVFTERLKDKVQTQANLALLESGGDVELEGAITGYSTLPVAIQGNETAASNRLTISVRVKFTNRKDEKQNFESAFSRYSDYDSRLNLSQVEEELIRQINEQLVDDIFNRAFINW